MFALPRFTGAGRYVDDLAAFTLGNHVLDYGFRAEERARQLDVDDPLEDAGVQLQDGHSVGAARVGGVIDEYIDAPELLDGAFHHAADALLAAHVRYQRKRTAALLANLVGHALDVAPAYGLLVRWERVGAAARARDDHVRAQPRQLHRGRPADTAQPARARYYGNLAV